MIRDRIVVGIRNSTLLEKLQLDPRLTLDSAITQVRQSEAVKQQQSLLRGKPDTPVGAINKLRGGITQVPGSSNSRGANPNTTTTSHKPHSRCNWCGKAPHDKARYPARDNLQKLRNRGGHFKIVCKSPARVMYVPSEDAFLGAVSESREGDPWTVKLTLQGRPVTLYIDLGAQVTVITEQAWRRVGRPQLDRIADTDIYVAKRLTKSLDLNCRFFETARQSSAFQPLENKFWGIYCTIVYYIFFGAQTVVRWPPHPLLRH